MWWTSSALAWKEDFWDAGKAKMNMTDNVARLRVVRPNLQTPGAPAGHCLIEESGRREFSILGFPLSFLSDLGGGLWIEGYTPKWKDRLVACGNFEQMNGEDIRADAPTAPTAQKELVSPYKGAQLCARTCTIFCGQRMERENSQQDQFRFCGREHVQHLDDFTKVSEKCTTPVSSSQRSALRSVISSLAWVALATRPDLAYRFNALQQRVTSATVETLREAIVLWLSTMLQGASCTRPDCHGAQASLAGEAGHKAQRGRIYYLTSHSDAVNGNANTHDMHLLSLSSSTMKRVAVLHCSAKLTRYSEYNFVDVVPPLDGSVVFRAVQTEVWYTGGLSFSQGALWFADPELKALGDAALVPDGVAKEPVAYTRSFTTKNAKADSRNLYAYEPLGYWLIVFGLEQPPDEFCQTAGRDPLTNGQGKDVAQPQSSYPCPPALNSKALRCNRSMDALKFQGYSSVRRRVLRVPYHKLWCSAPPSPPPEAVF
ncbi:unnamed protein product [Symbiodinium sp. KB8]|nr:unnamed protein product [Symbiodinium sp. KB8]